MSHKISTAYLQDLVKKGGKIIGVDVDTQHDFCTETFFSPEGSTLKGALYVPASKIVRHNLAQLTQNLSCQIGSVDSHHYDAWEFSKNGGPFPVHCVKGTPGWLKITETSTHRMGNPLPTRFIPVATEIKSGENKDSIGKGAQAYDAEKFAQEVLNGIQVLFEKEVYSAYFNPLAQSYIAQLVDQCAGIHHVVFAVYGYCTGGYCVDSFAGALKDKGYQVMIVEDATASLDFAPEDGSKQDGAARTRRWAHKNDIQMMSTQEILNILKARND